MNEFLFWVLFNIFVAVMLVLDLTVFHRESHTIRFREAIGWSVFWAALAAAFAVGLYFWRGKTPALEFTTGYLVEESLSVDNLFVFLLIFRYFRVPGEYQHKVLFWGIIGALVMRGIFIFAGVALLRRFHWIVYIFGAILIYSGVKLLREGETDVHPEKNPVLNWFRRWMPVTPNYVGGQFTVRDGTLLATPLLLVLIMIETTDVLFAADSIPAVLAISRDFMIVYTSNVFAIMGLRSLYFALAGMMEAFHYLHYGLAAILIFIGVKMLASEYYQMRTGLALSVIAVLLAVSIAASLAFPRPKQADEPQG